MSVTVPQGATALTVIPVATVLGDDAHERVDGALGARVQRVLGHAKVLCRVGRHQDDAPALVQISVRLTRHKELPACVEVKYAVELFL